MGPAEVFLSSTYEDLVFERRYVARWLRARGFRVVTMEDDCPPEFNWYQWSLNRAGQCDILLRLHGHRIGSKGGWWPAAGSVVYSEDTQAWPALIVSYQLQRPFLDADALYDSPEDAPAYQRTLVARDAQVWDPIRISTQWAPGEGTKIASVAELKTALERDVRLSRTQLLAHRCRRWRQYYSDLNGAAWYRAAEDESSDTASSRVAVLRRLRQPMTVFAFLLVAASWAWLSLAQSFVLFGAAVASVGAVVLATRPSFVWIGEKTVVARGLFGLRTHQQYRGKAVLGHSRWRLLQGWVDVGAVSVQFANGPRLFVPFIRDADGVAASVSSGPSWRPREPPPPPGPPIDLAAELFTFAKELEENERRASES